MAPKKSKANQENQNPTWEAATNASRSEIATSTSQPSNSNSTSGPSSSVNYHTEATGEVDDSLRLYADGEEPPNHSTTSVISNVSYTKMFIDNPPRRSSTATSQQSNAVAAAQSQFGDSSDSENESSEHYYPQPPPAVQSDATSRRLAALQKARDDYEELMRVNAEALLLENSSVPNNFEQNQPPVYELLPANNQSNEIEQPIRKRTDDRVHNMYNFDRAVILKDTINEENSLKYLNYFQKVETQRIDIHWSDTILPEAIASIRLRLYNKVYSNLVPKKDIRTWPESADGIIPSNLEIALLIRKLYGPAAKFSNTVSLEQQCKNHILEWDIDNEALEESSLLGYAKIITDFTMGTRLNAEEDHKMAKILASKLPRNCEIRNLFESKTRLELVNGYDSVSEAVIRLKCLLSEKRECLRVYKEFGPDCWKSVVAEKDKAPTSNNSSVSNVKASTAPAQSSQKDQKCNSCGQKGHIRIRCMWIGHPMSNKTELPWDSSPMGITWKNSGVEHMVCEHRVPGHPLVHRVDSRPYNNNPKKSMAHHHLDPDYNNNKRNYSTQNQNNQSSNSQTGQSNQTDKSPSVNTAYNNDVKKPRREFLPTSVCSTVITPSSDEYLTVSVSLPEQMTPPLEAYQDTARQPATTQDPTRATRTSITAPTPAVNCLALIDSGSIAGNFINYSLLKKLNGANRLYKSDKPLRVCSGLDNHCLTSDEVIDLKIEFWKDNIKHSLILQCRITSSGPIALIIGRDSIRQNKLVTLLPEFFFEKENSDKYINIKNCQTHERVTPCGCDTVVEAAAEHGRPYNRVDVSPIGPHLHGVGKPKKHVHFDDTPLVDMTVLATPDVPADVSFQTHGMMASVLGEPEHSTGVEFIGSDEIDDNTKDMFAPFRAPANTSKDKLSFIDKVVIEGSAFLQQGIRDLLAKYSSIFSDTLDVKPADIPPFDLDVDKKKWEVPRNRGPVRMQSLQKQDEIRRQIQEMIDNNIIEKSTASYYSQVMLTPKKDGKWRFCADYRNMNDCTRSASWPIPHGYQSIARIGSHKPIVYAIMDLTSGYHQAPLTLAARLFTAFITFTGVYQFTRLPFGPKRAPSYFQEMMATVVLAGLLYFICEMYIDDCIVFANSDEQLLERLETIFIRFKEKNVYLKASKCKFGLATVEYIGRQISKDGVTMSDSKINSVLDFPKPKVNTHLRSFLGLANYFRDFVPNHSNVVSPLHKMIDYSASKQTKLTWTPEGEKAFDLVKKLIANSPTLYFLHDTAPVILMTDASDYGVGGYLYQTVDDVKQLVALVSKALTPVQLKWSVIQKEAFAIYFCCTALDAQLRDRHFTILTDHKNLTFLKLGSNPMVVRWHLALQELDFSIEYVKGVDNAIADAMSRLCPNNSPPKVETAILSAIDASYVLTPEAYTNISKCHNEVIGHGGVNRTLRHLNKLKLHWRHMRLDVKTFIRECPCCQKMSQVKININAHKFVTSTYRPMECLNIDFIGPYPDKGYVLVIVDCFTRWVELYPVPEATANTAFKCLLQHFGRYGCPTTIRSDRGSHFANSVITQFLEATGTLQNLTLAYSSEENAIVERTNKEINRHLRALTFHKNTIHDYQEGLPFVQRIINSSFNERTTIAPSQVLFGDALDLDRGILIPFEEQVHPEPISERLTKMLTLQKQYIEISKNHLLEIDNKHKSQNTSDITEFPVDSFVLVQQRSAPETRLHTLWRGPMRVVKYFQGQYSLFDLTTLKTKEYHSTQLKKFVFNPIRTNPSDVARKDYLEFFIESIISHNGQINRLSSLKFKVKWLGYDESHNSFEPWKNLRDTEVLHLYLISNNLRQLIPVKFQNNYP